MDPIRESIKHPIPGLSHLKALIWWAFDGQSDLLSQHSNHLHFASVLFSKKELLNCSDLLSYSPRGAKIVHQNIWLWKYKNHWQIGLDGCHFAPAFRHILHTNMHMHYLQQHQVPVSLCYWCHCCDPRRVHLVAYEWQCWQYVRVDWQTYLFRASLGLLDICYK